MIVAREIPEELAQRLGPRTVRISREGLRLEAHRQGERSEAEVGRFLGLTASRWINS